MEEIGITMEELGVHEGPTLRFTKRWLPHLRPIIVQKIRESLPDPDFDILWEDVGTPNEHLHIEYDPT